MLDPPNTGAHRVAARFGAVVDRFLPPELLEGSIEAARRARLSVAAAWVAAAFFLFAAVGHVATGNRGATAVDAICGLLNVLAPFVARRTGRVSTVTHGVLAVVFCSVIALALLVRGAGLSGATLMLGLIPLFATLIISVRAGAIWAGVSLVSGLLLGLAGQAGLIHDQMPASTRLLNDHIVLAILTLVLFSIAALFELRKEEALKQISALETQRRMAELGELKAHTEAQLAESDRFASLGRIAAATAHEINNPLSFILGNAEMLTEGAAARGDTDEQEMLRDVLDGARRIQIVVRDMLASARPTEAAPAGVRVSEVLSSAIKLAEPHIAPRARVRIVEEGVPPVAGDEARLVQVFLNLLVNAAQAIPEGRASDHEIVIETSRRDNRVMVEVRDTGSGLPAQHSKGAKDAFFTPKRIGERSGLGLALSEAAVRSLGGSLELESVLGVTVARVTLVTKPSAETWPPTRAPSNAGVTSDELLAVLLIDDEPLVASALARMLAPHAVSVAHSGRQALRRLAAGESFDLIFCDLMMPELTGMDVFDQLQASAPQQSQRIVFMTGGTFTERSSRFRASVPNTFIEKPFDRQKVQEIVEERVQQRRLAALAT